jgi:hypothetical protein
VITSFCLAAKISGCASGRTYGLDLCRPNSLRKSDGHRDNLDSPMSRFLSCVLSILTCVTSFCAMASDAQSPVSSPIVVLEATSTIHANGLYQNQHLLVRLTGDGKVEWDKWVGNVWERQTSSVSAERVSEIRRTLDAIDKNLVHGKMGPYYAYVDTSVDDQIHMVVGQEEVTFSVTNPWPPGVLPNRKPMPKDVKAVVCEIDRLHAQVANITVNELCKASQLSH